MAYEDRYNKAVQTINSGYVEAGNNGLEGFKSWECYMLVKYGKPRFFRFEW